MPSCLQDTGCLDSMVQPGYCLLASTRAVKRLWLCIFKEVNSIALQPHITSLQQQISYVKRLHAGVLERLACILPSVAGSIHLCAAWGFINATAQHLAHFHLCCPLVRFYASKRWRYIPAQMAYCSISYVTACVYWAWLDIDTQGQLAKLHLLTRLPARAMLA